MSTRSNGKQSKTKSGTVKLKNLLKNIMLKKSRT